jgi:uncharacterized protein (TIGR04255 family)
MSASPMRAMAVNITESGGDVVHRDLGYVWNCQKNIGGTITLTLAHDSMSLNYGPADYTGFNPFFDEFNFILDALVKTCGINHFTRIGLRYVNEIRLPGRAMEWENIIDDRLVAATVASALKGGRLLRSMHQVHELHDEDNVLLNYGLINPDYPAPLVQRHFILDIDSFRQSVITTEEAKACLIRLNALCGETFEGSIGNDLRQIMEPK